MVGQSLSHPICEDGCRIMKDIQIQQMELGFQGAVRPVYRARQRSRRAAWWFERMRQVVDAAFDWSAAPQPRPEQTWLAYR